MEPYNQGPNPGRRAMLAATALRAHGAEGRANERCRQAERGASRI
jgi:hypothetical protein